METADHDSESITQEISASLNAVDHLAASINCTSASLLQALFGIALAETFKTDDVVFGTILSGRTVPVEGAHTILAPCITTVPQRVLLNNTSNLKHIISHAQDGFVESIEFQHTALRDIHRWIAADKPLFDTLFSYTRKREKAPWSHLWQETESSMPSEFPLAVEIVADHAADKLVARCDFTKAFGSSDEARLLLVRLEHLLRFLVEGETPTLNGIPDTKEGKRSPDRPTDGIWTSEEMLIRDIVADVAGLREEEITRGASFFALGINSIIGIQLAKRLRQEGLKCSSADIMRHSSIFRLAQILVSQGSRESLNNGTVDGTQNGNVGERPPAEDSPMSYTCTPLQSSMLTQTLGSDGSLYVHHHAIRLSSAIERSHFEQALEDLVENTEILRTSFHFSEQARVWSGRVHRNTFLKIREHDDSMELAHILPQIKNHFSFREENDFARPPWRLDIVGPVYIFSMHHSWYDEESLQLLFQDLAGFLKGQSTPARPSFSRAAIAMGQQSDKAQDHWLKTLQGYEGTRLIPNPNNSKETTINLDLNLESTLQKCKILGVTLQTVALLAYGKIIGSLSGRKDIVFGQIVRGRTLSPDADDIIGPLFNTISIRINLGDPAASNKTVLAKLQQQTGDAQPYQHASLIKVQQAWRELLGDSDAELLDSLFVFQKRAMSGESPPWELVDLEDDVAPTEHATNFECQQGEAEITVCINSTQIEDLDRFIRAFEQILRGILDRPDDYVVEFLNDLPYGADTHFKPMDGKRQQLDVAHEIDPSDGTFRKLRDVLAEISGIPAIDIVAETSIFSLGLDSLSADTNRPDRAQRRLECERCRYPAGSDCQGHIATDLSERQGCKQS